MQNSLRRSPAFGLLLCFVALGLALRLWQIGDPPFGFHTDEGHNALDAWRIASEGWRPIFLDRNNGREPLFMYLMAASMAVLGPSIASARLAGALCGALAILAQFILVRSLPIARAQRVALLSAAFLALTFWPIAQARYALRANLLPVWVALAVWAWWRAVDPGEESGAADAATSFARPLRIPTDRLLWPILAGAFIALAIHTHLTGRVLILIFITSALWRLLRDRRVDQFAPLLIAAATTFLLVFPQIRYFQTHPEMLSHRANQVSLLNPEVNEGNLPGALFENGINLLEMPVLRGDSSWYHNIKRRPVWPEPPAALAFLMGLGLSLRLLLGLGGRRAQLAAVLLTAALGVTTAPSLLSMGAPNYVRLTGIWPTLFLLPALGLDAAMAFVSSKKLPRWTAAALCVVTLGWLGLRSTNDYFNVYAQEPAVYTAFNAAAVERAQQMATLAADGPVYASPALWNQSVIRFVTLTAPPVGDFDMLQGLRFPPPSTLVADGLSKGGGTPLIRYLFDPVERENASDFGARWPMMRQAGDESLMVFELPIDQLDLIEDSLEPRTTPEIFGEEIRLLGASLYQPVSGASSDLASTTNAPPRRLEIDLLWEAIAPTETDRNHFIHVLALEDSRSLAQFDGPPLGGSHPTDRWQPGERILETYALPLSEAIPEGGVKVLIGWYDWRDGLRMKASAGEGDAVELGRLGE